jgi:thiamine-phosphate pyrophosphorylase
MSRTEPDSSVLRILDANLNRAREALRVMEEYARLGLDDAGLSGAIKRTRHALAEAAATWTDAGIAPIRSRDIVGDVGCELAAGTEYERADVPSVVMAATKRLSEALRVIEEYAKTIDADFAASIEQLRYRGYELERRLAITIDAQRSLRNVRLYVILTESLCCTGWRAAAEEALRGGADCLQLREKDLPDGALFDRASALCQLCHDHDALFIMNDRPDMAAACGADGVHLGQDDLPVAAARRMLPSRCLVGVSTHDVDQIEAAASVAPDYIAIGPMFPTSTKPQEHIAGPRMISEVRKRTALPVVPIGGITAENARDVLDAGATCLCVCTAVIAQADVAGAAARLRSIVDAASE